MSALHRAARRGDPLEMLRLLDEGADINEQLAANGETPLMNAAKSGYVPAVQLLLDRGAELNLLDSRGSSALSHSCTDEVTETLLQGGIDPDEGRTTDTKAVFWASFGEHERVALLLKFGANPLATNRAGVTVQELVERRHVRDFPRVRMNGTEALRKLSDDLLITPEEFVACNRSIYVFSLHLDEVDDPHLKQWAVRVDELLKSIDGREACYEQFLEGEELAKAQKAIASERRRQLQDEELNARRAEFARISGVEQPRKP